MVFLQIVDILLDANMRAISPPQPLDAIHPTRNQRPGG